MAGQIDWAFLEVSEARTVLKTEAELADECVEYPKAVEALMSLLYVPPQKVDANTPEGELVFYCSMHHLQSPYTFTSIYRLWGLGYYYEATILCRHLLEALVQMRYFRRHPDQLAGHITNKGRIPISRMFREVAPCAIGMYRTLCDVAHGGVTKDVFRLNRKSPTEGRIVMGVQRNEVWATYVCNIANALLHGFLKYYPDCFSVQAEYQSPSDVESKG